MPSDAETAVERVVDAMHERLGEPFTIDDMARVAMFSKYHFTRVFHQVTGLPPARYLSAVRIAEAKRLLLTTSLNVTDISLRVSYASLGTFGTRFRQSVGLSPLAFRESRGWRPLPEQPAEEDRSSAPCGGSVHGVVIPPPGAAGLLFVGLFPRPAFEGDPVRCCLTGAGRFDLDRVPPGRWHMFAYLTVPGRIFRTHPAPTSPCRAISGPVRVSPGRAAPPLRLGLRPHRRIDPPMLGAMYTA
ncbi:AraC family transcriptional regulator [Kineosporia sp. NBRC 101731]|uniref:helix-turn-helix domain-containing protein n=1 Tax=Kineosporia sp. NBRC 101731 TaxID=3032199 RepID=UPI0024A05CD3|nr:AraC family transcriptional regulator [Kineosporia sp. NBRC 101731]GLY30387.1 AraC family transcriptional regulator [Kineosporia sp. NBRC 101731]